MTQVWRDAHGKLFHDKCFDEGESRNGYTSVAAAEITDEDECDSCGGAFVDSVEEVVEDDDESDET